MATLTFRSTDGTLVVGDLDHVCQSEEDRYLALAGPEDRPALARKLLALRVAERRLAATATEAQHAIGWGAHVAVLMPALVEHTVHAAGFDGTVRGLMPDMWPRAIYGQVYTRNQVRDGERQARDKLELAAALGLMDVAAHASPDAYPVIVSAHRAGWRYGRWFSLTDPDGDVGMHHVAHLVPVTEQQFRAARRDGWPPQIPPG